MKPLSTSPTRRRRRALALMLATTLALSAVVSVGTASAAKTTEHCLARVVGKSESGELKLSTPVCYATYAEVLSHVGGGAAAQRAGGGATTMSGGTFIIGTHYDGAWYTGSSFSVEGSDCYGGYLNLSGWWANRVSSTANGCPTIWHYYWPDLGGSSEATTGGGGNLSTLNNLSESIQYSGW